MVPARKMSNRRWEEMAIFHPNLPSPSLRRPIPAIDDESLQILLAMPSHRGRENTAANPGDSRKLILLVVR
ncbi:unnamed protein product [Linum trigynum]|uniref:Uncharacterized protein n=1 Tax=Linum trigynum TaxID=586398 RepID=A0AAV2D395_9ROSI